MRHGKPLVEHIGIDLSGLNEAEAAVAVLAGAPVNVTSSGEFAVARLGHPSDKTAATGEVAQALGFELPTSATADTINNIRTRLRDLGGRWRSLEDGAAITLSFSRPTT